MPLMYYCPQHKEVWAYDYSVFEIRVESVQCQSCDSLSQMIEKIMDRISKLEAGDN